MVQRKKGGISEKDMPHFLDVHLLKKYPMEPDKSHTIFTSKIKNHGTKK